MLSFVDFLEIFTLNCHNHFSIYSIVSISKYNKSLLPLSIPALHYQNGAHPYPYARDVFASLARAHTLFTEERRIKVVWTATTYAWTTFIETWMNLFSQCTNGQLNVECRCGPAHKLKKSLTFCKYFSIHNCWSCITAQIFGARRRILDRIFSFR